MKKVKTMLIVIGIMLMSCTLMNQTRAAKSNSDFKIAYTENNYDFTYSPVVHADLMTLNMTIPIWNMFNSRGISVSQTYFWNKSKSMAYDSETLLEYPALRNYAILHQNINGIYTHSLRMNTALTTAQTLATLNAWKSYMGSYPMIWVDHGGLPQNIDEYGGIPGSQYYIGGLRSDSCLKYVWVNYENSNGLLPAPSDYNMYARNSLDGFSDGRFGLVYSNNGNTNLFTSGDRILLPEFYVSYDSIIQPIAAERGLALEHCYEHWYVYKNINGIKYTMSIPKPSGYSSWPYSWNLHYRDATNPWLIMPEYVQTLDDILAHYTIATGLGHLLIDRGVVYNGSSLYKTGSKIYVNTPSVMKNVTIYTATNESGQALYKDGNYCLFTKGYNSWGATIPSVVGNQSYSLVAWNKYVKDNGQIGRLVYGSDGTVNIHFKRAGSVTLQLDSVQNISVENVTGGGTVSFTVSGNLITFLGGRNCQYLITGIYSPPPTTLIVSAEGLYSGIVNQSIVFTAIASGGTSPYRYEWDWTNDGTYETGYTSSSTANHSYLTAGNYTVKILVQDSANATATAVAIVVISVAPPPPAPPVPSLIISSISPANGSSGTDLTPTVSAYVAELHGHLFNVSILQNSSGIWNQMLSSNNKTNGTYKITYSQATAYSYRYWWKVVVQCKTKYQNMTCSFTTKPSTPPTSILTKYEYFDMGTTGVYSLYGSTWFAQTRTTGTDGSNIAHTVSQIAIFGYRVGSPGTVTVSIRNVDANGQPTGNDLCSGTLNGNSWATSSIWYNFTMSPSTVVLNSNQKYAYIIRAANGDSNDYICIRAKDFKGYSGGTLFRSKNSGSSWSDYSSDAYFREYGYAQ